MFFLYSKLLFKRFDKCFVITVKAWREKEGRKRGKEKCEQRGTKWQSYGTGICGKGGFSVNLRIIK